MKAAVTKSEWIKLTSSTIYMLYENKKASVTDAFFRGREQIRTAVRGFADLCLATRPRDQFLMPRKTNKILSLQTKVIIIPVWHVPSLLT